MNEEEYVKHDAVGLAELVVRREVSASELVEAALMRMDKINGAVNAVVFRLDQQAREAAARPQSGRFAGLPFLAKNLDGTIANVPLTMGCRALRDYVAKSDSELIARYRQAGIIFIGTTNTPELGLLATTEPELHGPTRNPWNLAHSAGGSSGGAAAAVAAEIVPAAQGGDGGGSIRIPASACGLFGLKPSRGRMPLGPDVADGWNGFVVPHVITRSVRDSAALLDVSHGPDVGAPYVASEPERPYLDEIGRNPGKLRVAFTTRSILGEITHPDCIQATQDTVKLLSSLGHEVEEVKLPISAEEVRLAYLTVICACTAETVDSIAAQLNHPARSDLFEASTWFLRQVGHALSAVEYEQARTTIGQLTRGMGEFFTTHDVLVTPTMAYPPVKIGELDLKPAERFGLAALRLGAPALLLRRILVDMAAKMFEKTPNTMLFNMTGQPAMSVPLQWNTQGLPIGMQFATSLGSEALLFRLAAQLEEAKPWKNRRPQAHV